MVFKTCVYSIWVLYCGGSWTYVHNLQSGIIWRVNNYAGICQDYPGSWVNSSYATIIGGIRDNPDSCFIQPPACECEAAKAERLKRDRQ
jgi:hypothetical protein